MSISLAREKRTALYLSIAGLVLVVAALSAISARDPDGITIRTGMILVTVGAAMWLPWQALLPITLAVWFGPNAARSAADGYELFNLNMVLELPGLLGLAAMSNVARISLKDLESESQLIGMKLDTAGTDPVTGVYDESQLRRALETELSRSRRFGRTFALVLVGIDEMRQRFDYRDEAIWQTSFYATADLLSGTRANVDRVYRFGPAGFALLLPESGPKDVNGLVKRLRRVARKAKPPEGEPGGPLPAHYGATFFPACATTVEDLLRRAEIALRISDNNASRVQLDGAEAPEMPPVETLRQSPTAEETLEAPEPDVAAPALRVVEEASTETQAEPAPAETDTPPAVEPAPSPMLPEPVASIEEMPVEQLPEVETPQSLIAAVEVEAAETEFEQPEPEPVAVHAVEEAHLAAVEQPNYSTDPDAIEVDEEPPFEVFAYRAPEPAVDVYNNDWQAEAPLSVIRRPNPKPRLVALNGGADEQPPIEDETISDALKQLDGTLALIRSLKQRSA